MPKAIAGRGDVPQRAPYGLLSVLAGMALVLALIGGYIGGAILDSQHFAHRASAALDDASVRSEVAGAVSDSISSAASGTVPTDQVGKAVDGVIAEPQFGGQFRAAVAKVHSALVDQGADSATLELNGIGPLVAKRLQGGNPGMPAPGSVPGVRLAIKPPSAALGVVRALNSLSWVPAVLGLLALALLAALIVRADDRVRGLRRAGITTLVAGVVIVAIYFVLREVVVNGASNSGAAGGIFDAYFGDLAIAALVLVGAGALGWFAASRIAPAIRTEPAAVLRPVELPTASTGRPSEAATRVLGAQRAARVDLPTKPEAPPPSTRERPTKACPDCAETVLAAARVCKHCGYRFEPVP